MRDSTTPRAYFSEKTKLFPGNFDELYGFPEDVWNQFVIHCLSYPVDNEINLVLLHIILKRPRYERIKKALNRQSEIELFNYINECEVIRFHLR